MLSYDFQESVTPGGKKAISSQLGNSDPDPILLGGYAQGHRCALTVTDPATKSAKTYRTASFPTKKAAKAEAARMALDDGVEEFLDPAGSLARVSTVVDVLVDCIQTAGAQKRKDGPRTDIGSSSKKTRH